MRKRKELDRLPRDDELTQRIYQVRLLRRVLQQVHHVHPIDKNPVAMRTVRLECEARYSTLRDGLPENPTWIERNRRLADLANEITVILLELFQDLPKWMAI